MSERIAFRWFFIGALVLIGLGLLGFAAVVHLPEFVGSFLPALGTASLVAGLLAASVDQWLKRDLARDAFRAVFGYMLPGELRDELGWVYGQELLCDRFELRFRLRPIEGDVSLVSAVMELSRDFRNVASHVVHYEALFAADEWFHEGHPSHVRGLQVTHGDITDDAMMITHEGPEETIVAARLPPVRLGPGDHVTVVAEADETRYVSDAWFLNVIHATANPHVTIDAPDDMDFYVTYGFNRQAGEANKVGPRTWLLPGTLLPGQIIQVRWWQSPVGTLHT
jgi:hypothetical protein